MIDGILAPVQDVNVGATMWYSDVEEPAGMWRVKLYVFCLSETGGDHDQKTPISIVLA